MSRITSAQPQRMQLPYRLQTTPRFMGMAHTHEDGTTCHQDHEKDHEPKAPLLHRMKDWLIEFPSMLKAFFTDAWKILWADLKHLFSGEKPHVHDEHCKH